ncbi:hypothetical protein [Serratia sp. DD3]|uniref:hypothetical protein n=1 Tax=Serratia sp. DD3 TaxID=1410619 RepID=UPI0003C51AE5|nr:hypothetical protein [Serratia sp. DD3]KEY58862.1 hypothetical protein SRDD_22520 [Serratia sp. DD3]
MEMKKQITTIFAVAVLAFLMGGNAANAENVVANANSGVEYPTKLEGLSSNNKSDITSDLTALGQIIKAHNIDVIKTQDEINSSEKAKDTTGLIAGFNKSQAIIMAYNAKLTGLTIKSQEAQDVIAKIVKMNNINSEMFEFIIKSIKNAHGNKAPPLSQDELTRMESLHYQSMALFEGYSKQIEKLNQEHGLCPPDVKGKACFLSALEPESW